MSRPSLYLMLGYPGAGKTTAAEMVAELTGAVHLSSDKFRLHMFPTPQFTEAEHAAVYGALDYMTEVFLSKGVSVIYDANLNRYQHRKEKYDICRRTHADAHLLWLQTPESLAKQRATELGEQDKARRPYGNLDVMVFDRLAREIEVPHTVEPVIEIDGTSLNLETLQSRLAIKP